MIQSDETEVDEYVVAEIEKLGWEVTPDLLSVGKAYVRASDEQKIWMFKARLLSQKRATGRTGMPPSGTMAV